MVRAKAQLRRSKGARVYRYALGSLLVENDNTAAPFRGFRHSKLDSNGEGSILICPGVIDRDVRRALDVRTRPIREGTVRRIQRDLIVEIVNRQVAFFEARQYIERRQRTLIIDVASIRCKPRSG